MNRVVIGRPAPALRVFREVADPAARLVCFPHAGGGASFFRRWADLMPASVDLVGVQYAGREDRLADPFAADLAALAGEAATALLRQSAAPSVLFGHSLGAAVAFETAVRLQAAGSPPALLVVSGRAAPRDEGREVHLLDDDGMWADLENAGGTRDELLRNPEVRSMLLPILRSDYRLSAAYHPVPGTTVDCPILACTGDSDPDVPGMPDWAAYTTGPFEMRVFEGNHFYLIEARRQLVELILGTMAALPSLGALWPTAP